MKGEQQHQMLWWSRGLVLWEKSQLQEYFAIANRAPLPQSLSRGAGVTLEGGRWGGFGRAGGKQWAAPPARTLPSCLEGKFA